MFRSRSVTNESQPSPDTWQRDSWDKDVVEHTRVVRRKYSDAGRSRSQDGRRSVTSINRYNSYSSDDEGNILFFFMVTVNTYIYIINFYNGSVKVSKVKNISWHCLHFVWTYF